MKRVVTAAILVPTFAAVVLVAPAWLFFAALLAVALLSFYEFSGLVKAYGYPAPGPAATGRESCWCRWREPDYALLTLLALVFLTLAANRRDLSASLPYSACCTLGLLYAFGSWKCAIPLRSISPVVAAIRAGHQLGGRFGGVLCRQEFRPAPLAPAVSPKKTWEGTLASLAVTAGLGVLYILWRFPHYPWLQAVLVCVLANAAGQWETWPNPR